jgi:LmbE family N-acetylglucosaminyl deacetylase
VSTNTKPSAFPQHAPTGERAWLDWMRALPALDWSATFARATRVVVVSPHPDDETLACGGLIAELVARRIGLTVVAVTDGEGSHPEVAELAAVRRIEQRRALHALGHRGPPIRLGLPDASVACHASQLRARLQTLVSGHTVLIAPWSRDGHTDHDACGAAAEAVAEHCGCALLEYPVWAWQWATPSELDEDRWSTFEIAAPARRAKSAALECFPSQTTERFGAVIVDEHALARFRRPCEVVARVR